jgi:hypothetical protein
MLVEGRKAHRCCACGTLYAFPADLRVGGVKEDPGWDAIRDAVTSVQSVAIDPVPCPNCGQMQPEMSATARTRTLQTVSIAFAVGGVLLLVFRFLSVGGSAAFLVGLAFPLLALLATLLVLRRPVVGLAIAEIVEPGLPATRADTVECRDFSARPLVGPLLFMTLGLLLMCSTWLFVPLTGAIQNHGWKPPYFGPGDTSEIVLTEPIVSLDGRWRGTARATMVGPDGEDVGVEEFEVLALVRPWDDERIVTKGHRNAAPGFRVTFPSDPKLADRRLKLHLGGDIAFPVQAGESAYVVQDDWIDATMLVGLSSAGLADTFRTWWYVVSALGVLLTVAGLWALTYAVRRRRYHERGWFKTDQAPPPPAV